MKRTFTLVLIALMVSAFGQDRTQSLPFNEDFNQYLNVQNWTVTGGQNWRISASMGEPAPCIIFYGNSTNYNQSLESDFLNGTVFTSGAIYLDFDKLTTVINSTGAEILTIEVNNGSGWQVVHEFDNGGGGSSWGRYHYDITNMVSGTNFKIRFRAHGSNFADMNAWGIDDVKVSISPLGVDEQELASAKIYPNPTNGPVNFQLTENIKEISIYDILGTKRLSILVTGRTKTFKTNLSELNEGIWLIKFITDSGKTVTRRLVISGK
jgi:hypothetical protein